MMLLPRGLKVHLALGYTDMRKGIDGLAMLVQAVTDQDRVQGWDRSVPLHQAARTGRVPLATGRRTGRDTGAELGAAINAD
jgi:hypothetical protein